MLNTNNSNLLWSFYRMKLVKEHAEEQFHQQQEGHADFGERDGKLLQFYDQ
jgi:hypothetical protein